MADNVDLAALAGNCATLNASFSGDTANFQAVALVGATGSEGAWTIGVLPGDATNGLTVNLGTNNDVTLATLPDTAGGDLAAITTAVQLIDNAVSGAGFNITQFGGAAVPIGAGVEATAVRVTLATDSTGVVSIDDNSGSITVDNAGTFATQIDGAALTALQLIDDAIFTDDAAYTLGTSKGVMMMGFAGTQSVNANDAAALACQTDGSLNVYIAGNGLNSSTYIDDGDWTAVTSYHTLTGGVYASGGRTVTDGDTAPFAMDSAARIMVSIEADNAGIGGGTQYTEDVATPAAIVGNALMMERDDALTTVTPIEGDWLGARGTAEGALWVQDFNSDAILADTTTIAGDTTSIDGKITACNTGAVVISSGTITAVTDITNTIDSTISGAALTALQLIDDVVYSEDAATPATIIGNATVMERDDALTTVTPIEGDWIGLRGTAEGALWTQDFNSDTMVTHLATLAGAVSTEMQVDIVGSLPAGTNGIGKLTANSGVDIGDVDVTSISAGSNLIGDVGLSGARTSGGTTIFRSIDLDESEEEIKATAGQLYWIHAMNLSASKLFLKFYNLTAASTTVGTSTPVLTFPVPTLATTNGAGFVFSVPNGIAFSTAITAAATTGVADADTGAPGANELILNCGYA